MFVSNNYIQPISENDFDINVPLERQASVVLQKRSPVYSKELDYKSNIQNLFKNVETDKESNNKGLFIIPILILIYLFIK